MADQSTKMRSTFKGRWWDARPEPAGWAEKLSGVNSVAVVLCNRGASSASINVQWSAIGIPAAAAAVRDLWAHTDLGSFNASSTAASVPGHGVAMLKVTGTTSP